MTTKKLSLIITFIIFAILEFSLILVYVDLRNRIHSNKNDPIPSNIVLITKRMKIILIESETKSRTLLLDPNQTYCKIKIFYGGNDPFSQDLAYPKAPIVFFFLEDIEDPEKADNYSDLIIRMNSIIDPKDNKLKEVIVFFCEGGYEKKIYGDDVLLHHYLDSDPTSNYGIRMFDYGEDCFT